MLVVSAFSVVQGDETKIDVKFFDVENMMCMSDTLLVSNDERSSVRRLLLWNMPYISFTFAVSKLETSSEKTFDKFENILFIFVTLCVSKLLTSRVDIFLQKRNIAYISVQAVVLKLLTSSMFTKDTKECPN